MEKEEEQLRTELMEAMLDYLEEKRTFQSVVLIGISVINNKPLKDQSLSEVVSQLNSMGNQVTKGKKFSKEEITATFTTMLEVLTKK